MKRLTRLRRLLIASLLLLCMYGFTDDLSKSVVKIYVTALEYDYYSPWQLKNHSSVTLSGTVIDSVKGYILTLSHPLLDNVQVEVSKLGDDRRYPATVFLADYSTGLALITVDQKDFFKDLVAAKLFDKKNKLGSASIVKWDDQQIFKSYSCEPLKTAIQSYEEFGVALFHEMTTALDSGGNGEPVFQSGKLTGLVAWFDASKKTVKVNSFETIGWLLKELGKGKYRGQPFFYVQATYLRGDENLKEYLGLGPKDTGIVIESIPVSSSGAGVLMPQDVIVSIDGQKIDDIGYTDTPEYGKLNFLWLIGLKHFVGDSLLVTVVRDRKRTVVTFPLVSSAASSFLIPPQYLDSPPRYYITGGLLFQELSKPYMETWGNEWDKKGDKRFLRFIANEWASPQKSRRRITILDRVLPAQVNVGYHDMSNLVLTSVDGTKVSDIAHLKNLIENAKDDFIVFEFMGNEKIIIERKALVASTKDILDRYGVTRADNIQDKP